MANINGNGIKLPVWSASVILVVILQLIGFIMAFSEIKTNQRHLQADVGEIKFKLGNIQEHLMVDRDNSARFEERILDIKRRVDRLEDK